MHSNTLKITLLALFVLLLAVAFTGCYTQVSKARDYSYYEEEAQDVEEPAETTYDDEEYVQDEPDTIIVHNSNYDSSPNRYDVYVQDWAPTVYIDAWWYQPYWSYRSSSWWNWHHRWDPWYGYGNYWGDPWYWPSFSYYGGWALYDPWYGYGGYWGSPYYGHNYHNGNWGGHGNYYGGRDDRDWERRPFGFGNYPGGGRSGMTPNTARGTAEPNVRPTTTGRQVAPRSTDPATRSRSTNATDEWYNGETRREPVRRGSENGATVTRPTTGREPSTTSGETRRRSSDQDENAGTGANRRETPTRERTPEVRRSTKPGVSQPNVNRTPTRPKLTPPVERKKDEDQPATKKQSDTRKRETPSRVQNNESRRSSASATHGRSGSSSSARSTSRSGSSSGHSSPPARSSGSSYSGRSSSRSSTPAASSGSSSSGGSSSRSGSSSSSSSGSSSSSSGSSSGSSRRR